MSYAFNAALVAQLSADGPLTALLGTDPDAGGPAIYPYHYQSIQNPVYPLLTVCRFGDGLNADRFQESDYADVMDNPKIAICAWNKTTLDKAIAIIERIETLLKGKCVTPTAYVSSYPMKRTARRDDIFDTVAQAYHVHTEWKVWTQNAFNNPFPIPT